MPTYQPTTPSPGPGYYWDPFANNGFGQWVPPGQAPPTPGASGGGATGTTGQSGGASGAAGSAPPPPEAPPPSGQTDTTAAGKAFAAGAGQGSGQIVDKNGTPVTTGNFDTDSGKEWQLDNRTVENTQNQTNLADALQKAVTTPVSRDVPQVSTGPHVTSDVTTAAKPTATLAGPADKITAKPIDSTTVAPAAQITAAQVTPTAGATAGQVTAAQVDQGPQAQFRAQQQRLTDALEAASRGEAPSAAEIQGRRQAEDAMASQLAVVGMNHGRGANAALRTAGRNIAGIQSRAAADAAALRANEMATARGQLTTALGQGREQDIGLATTNANLTQSANTTNAQLGTQVSISNADREAARAMKDADLLQAARTGNAAAINELNERQATLDAARRTQDAANELEAAKNNQASDLATGLKNAELATNTSIVGATEENKVSLANAANDLQAQIQNQNNETTVALKNAGFTLEGRQLDDARNVAAVNEALQAQEQLATGLDKQQQYSLARDQYNQAIKDKDWNRAMQIITAIVSAGSTVGAAYAGKSSDRRAKTSVQRESDKDVGDFLSALEAWNYRYKDPSAPGADPGRMSGPMAQELEKSLIGRSAVKTGSDGKKMVDTGRLTLALTGAVARLAKQQRREGRAG